MRQKATTDKRTADPEGERGALNTVCCGLLLGIWVVGRQLTHSQAAWWWNVACCCSSGERSCQPTSAQHVGCNDRDVVALDCVLILYNLSRMLHLLKQNASDSRLLLQKTMLCWNFLLCLFATSRDLCTHNNKCSWWEELVKSWGVTISIHHKTRRNITTEQSKAEHTNTHWAKSWKVHMKLFLNWDQMCYKTVRNEIQKASHVPIGQYYIYIHRWGRKDFVTQLLR